MCLGKLEWACQKERGWVGGRKFYQIVLNWPPSCPIRDSRPVCRFYDRSVYSAGSPSQERETYLSTTAFRSSTMSKWISFLLYRSPAFLHGMGDEKGPVPGDVLRLAPATERSFERRDGGRTMSRSILGEVVSGWPPESSVSSSSWLEIFIQHTRVRQSRRGTFFT